MKNPTFKPYNPFNIRKVYNQIHIILFLLIALPVCLFAKTEEEPLVKIGKKTWTVGISVFQTELDSQVMQSSTMILSRLVHDELIRIDERQLTDFEKLSMVRDAIVEKTRSQIDKLKKLIQSRDDLFFALERNNIAISKKDEEIVKEMELLTKLKKLSPLEVSVPESLPVEFPKNKDGGDIWDLKEMEPEMFRQLNDLDLLISGEIVGVGEYFGIAAYAWTANGRFRLWEGAGSTDEFKEVASRIGLEAQGLVLGRDWASLTVVTDPQDATISVNGEPVGVGYWSDSSLHPGLVNIEATMPGYRHEIRTESLLNGEISHVSIDLEKTEVAFASIDSIPSGADLRLGTRWLGTTPLTVPLQERIMPITLEKEGYRVKTVPFAPDSERLVVKLVPDKGNPLEKVNDARRKFNNSAVWFAFSLAPTIFFTGMKESYSHMQSVATNNADYQEAYNGWAVTTGAYWGSFALNGGLLIVSLVRLAKFLKAVEELKD